MRVPRIFSHEPLPVATSEVEMMGNPSFTLREASQVNYLFRVLRMKSGDAVSLFDGRSGYWQAEITEISKQYVKFAMKVFVPDQVSSPLKVEIGQCISRGERMDYAIQKAVEMGASSITPLFSDFCEVRLNRERQQKRTQHWQRIAISACEQCGQNRLPVINPPESLGAWSASCQTDIKLVLHKNATNTLSSLSKPASISLIVGPEGGLSDEEIKTVQTLGFYPVTLGPRILRTETAPVAALAVIQYLWGDWNS